MKTTSKFILIASIAVLANLNVSSTILAQRQYRETDNNMRNLIQRIETDTDTLRRSLENALDRSSGNRAPRNSTIGRNSEIDRLLANFQSATNQLKTRFEDRQSTSADARAVLDSASQINNFLIDNGLEVRVDQDWRLLRADLDQLARAYYINNWQSNSRGPSSGGGRPILRGDERMTGTYRLNTSQSDNAQLAAENATRSLPATQRQRVYDSLMRRLDPPDTLAIERRGTNVTIASSRAQQINFVADGSEHVETNPNGRTVRVRASFSGDQLSVTRSGDRAQDFTVTFDPLTNGRQMIVTRRLYSDQLGQPVTIRSYYDKSSDVAELNLYTGSPDDSNATTAGDFVVPDGTQLVAVLNTNLSTNTARNNDRFTMTVRSPAEFDGATIEGYVTNVSRSGRLSGRSTMTLNFDNIRLRDGRTRRFAGIIESVRTTGGETVRVDNEGTVRDEDQTNRTIQRTAIGTAMGAIIGAIAGGGKGAAIGAVVGAGTGAGSVYVQGNNDLDLTNGTEVTIRSTGPR